MEILFDGLLNHERLETKGARTIMSKTNVRLMCGLSCLTICSSALAETWYVNETAAGRGDGKSWTTATTLDQALERSNRAWC